MIALLALLGEAVASAKVEYPVIGELGLRSHVQLSSQKVCGRDGGIYSGVLRSAVILEMQWLYSRRGGYSFSRTRNQMPFDDLVMQFEWSRVVKSIAKFADKGRYGLDLVIEVSLKPWDCRNPVSNSQLLEICCRGSLPGQSTIDLVLTLLTRKVNVQIRCRQTVGRMGMGK